VKAAGLLDPVDEAFEALGLAGDGQSGVETAPESADGPLALESEDETP
jgi:hypothetical protein